MNSLDDVNNNYQNFLQAGAGFWCPPLDTVSVKGVDAGDFLQRMVSQDLRSLGEGDFINSALLQPSGTVSFIFKVLKLKDEFILITESERRAQLREDLERFHFAEDFVIADEKEFSFIEFFGPDSQKFITLFDKYYLFNESDERFTLVIESQEPMGEKIERLGLAKKACLLGAKTVAYMDYEKGKVSIGKDVTEKTLVVEAPFENFVSRHKGCYPGQEVVERVCTYGVISKKLAGLKFQSPLSDDVHLDRAKISFGATEFKDAGHVTSSQTIPWTGLSLGVAMLRKPFYRAGEKLRVHWGESFFEVEVYELPNTFKIEKEKI